MHKFFDYLDADLPLTTINELLKYIRNFVSAFGGDTPLEGTLGSLSFCATPQSNGDARVHWVKVGKNRILIDACV